MTSEGKMGTICPFDSTNLGQEYPPTVNATRTGS